MSGKGLWPCLRHCIEDNPSAQHCLLSSGRILGIEGFSYVLTWASPLLSSRALHLLPSLKNQTVFQASAVCCDLLSWLLMEYPESLSSFLKDHGLSIISVSRHLHSPAFPFISMQLSGSTFENRFKTLLGAAGNSWAPVVIPRCRSRVP